MPKHWRPWEHENSDSCPEHSHNTPDELANRASTNSEVCCECCGTTFRRESELKRHKSSVHIRKFEYCKICKKAFTRKDNLTRHLRLAHSSGCKPSCKYCLKPLSRKDAVQRHEATCSKNSRKNSDILITSHLQRLQIKLEKSKCKTEESTKEIVRNKNEI
ncbi:unnamed protein product [Orchesella dallaii]|uniref:C2H2-type domain-containing protein n=1 Tax=Orchesella dallaii TaxID=48710 RepID=A0ABP1PV07_9HEXA